MEPGPRYWPRYCEENVWRECEPSALDGAEACAVFVSNTDRTVAMWEQRSAREGRPVVWDYHVFLSVRRTSSWIVIDPDCRLTGEIPTAAYFSRSFPDLPAGLASLRPRFRVVPAAVYREALCTDRSHMRADGEWLSEPPPWPAIGSGTNLMRFVDMEDAFLGEILGIDELRSRLAPRAR
jgi:hypothetical protein